MRALRGARPSRVSSSTPAAPRRRPRATLVIATAALVVVALWTFLPDLIAPSSPLRGDVTESLDSPSLSHLFGTDVLGRDVFSRVVHGTRATIAASTLAVGIGMVLGVLLGLLAGASPGVAETAIMRTVDVLLAIPGLLLAMTIVTALGYGTLNVAIAVGIAAIPAFARVTRSEVIRVMRSDYVEAAQLGGASRTTVLTRHVLPNATLPIVALAALEFGSAVLSVAALGFLGYGAPPPDPEWGLAVVEGRDLLATHPWLSLLPGLVITVVVLAANRLNQEMSERS